ncbi:MAG TPA: alanine racemase [candidate division Zixibacteria bacterium]|nr:alanine racemase [candidate division Zixibacteria bacterium]
MPPAKKLQWIELSQKAMHKNIRSLSSLAPNKLLAACVKANAYGHGITETVKILLENNNVNYLTVHSMREAIKCRRAGWRKQIMLLGPVELCDSDAVLEFDIEPVVFNTKFLENIGKRADKFNRTVRTHLKLETGTNRQGITEKDIAKFAAVYKKYKSLGKPYGASTHFANIEDTTNHEYAEYQLEQFHKLLQVMTAHKIKPTIRHTASSAATILFGKTHFEMVRPGISLYGYWPSKETYLSHKLSGGENNLFEPVLTWKSRITQIKKVESDSFISYGCTYQTTSKSKIGIIPVGYYDGYDRALSNKAYLLINGKRAPIRGRVCMNLMMADITDIPKVKLENEVTLLGCEKNEHITANRIAEWADTINYEILARLSGEIYREIVP